MRQHFAEFLGVSAWIFAAACVDKPAENRQPIGIGIHLGSRKQFHPCGANENLEHNCFAAVARDFQRRTNPRELS
jgi:hypothetical protein